jgi:hypothetical protein
MEVGENETLALVWRNVKAEDKKMNRVWREDTALVFISLSRINKCT